MAQILFLHAITELRPLPLLRIEGRNASIKAAQLIGIAEARILPLGLVESPRGEIAGLDARLTHLGQARSPGIPIGALGVEKRGIQVQSRVRLPIGWCRSRLDLKRRLLGALGVKLCDVSWFGQRQLL